MKKYKQGKFSIIHLDWTDEKILASGGSSCNFGFYGINSVNFIRIPDPCLNIDTALFKSNIL